MAVPVARVHLKMAHAALPALLPTPPKWVTLQQLLPSPRVSAVIIPKPPLAKPSRRADSDERWDAHKVKPGCPAYSASPSSADSAVRSSARRESPRKKAMSPPPTKKAASLASSSSSSGTSSLVSSSKWPISRAASAERWDVHKKRCPPRAEPAPLDDGESSSTGSNDIDAEEEEEEILWKPRPMYAGPGFVVAAPQPSLIPMPTAFLVHVA